MKCLYPVMLSLQLVLSSYLDVLFGIDVMSISLEQLDMRHVCRASCILPGKKPNHHFELQRSNGIVVPEL